MIGSYARRMKAPDYPWGATQEERDALLPDDPRRSGAARSASRSARRRAPPTQAFRDWWASYLRMGASPGAAVALTRMNAAIDVRAVLPSIRVPTLVAAPDRGPLPEGGRGPVPGRAHSRREVRRAARRGPPAVRGRPGRDPVGDRTLPVADARFTGAGSDAGVGAGGAARAAPGRAAGAARRSSSGRCCAGAGSSSSPQTLCCWPASTDRAGRCTAALAVVDAARRRRGAGRGRRPHRRGRSARAARTGVRHRGSTGRRRPRSTRSGCRRPSSISVPGSGLRFVARGTVRSGHPKRELHALAVEG